MTTKTSKIFKTSFRSVIFIILTFSIALWTKTAVSEETGSSSCRMPVRPLGRTGFEVPLFSLGGQAIMNRTGQTEKAVEIINRALDLGVKYIDTAPRYGRGAGETYIGEVMKNRRDEVFLATKSHDWTYQGTMRLFQESQRRLQTDRIDLYQHHGVFHDWQLERVTSEHGALRAFLELKENGKVRFIGMTSHSPRILLKALELDVYDCMLITLNPAGHSMLDREYLDEFMAKAKEKGVGVIAMNSAGGGSLLRRGVKFQDLLRYSWSYPVATTIVGISDTWQIEENIRAAKEFKEMEEEEKRELEKLFQ